MLSQSIIYPHLLSYRYIFGEFEYSSTLLAPPGKRVVIYNRPNYSASWEPHGEAGWYIVLDM